MGLGRQIEEPDFNGKIVMLDLWPIGEEHRPLENRLQLSDVARPMIAHEEPHRLVGDPSDRLS